jgi:hypothetical protein
VDPLHFLQGRLLWVLCVSITEVLKENNIPIGKLVPLLSRRSCLLRDSLRTIVVPFSFKERGLQKFRILFYY